MTARRLLLLTVLGALALAGVGSYAVFGAPSKPDFSLSLSPTGQTVAQGGTATYSVTILRQGGFANAVALSVSGATSGLGFTFSPASPVSGSATTMTVTASAAAATGNRSLTLTGTGGGKTRTAAFSVDVQPAATPTFDLTVTPSAQTITQDDTTSFGVAIVRRNGFASTVALSVSGLPKKTTATFTPTSIAGPGGTSSTLGLVTAHNAETGVFPLVVTATGGSVTRTATVTLRVDKKQTFQIAGNAATTLQPGSSSVVDLTLTNPNNFAIRVGPLSVAVEEQTTRAGCSGTGNFTTTGLVGTVDVPGNTTATLTQLGVPAASLPRVVFLDTPANQDACKGARITMQYSGTAVKP